MSSARFSAPTRSFRCITPLWTVALCLLSGCGEDPPSVGAAGGNLDSGAPGGDAAQPSFDAQPRADGSLPEGGSASDELCDGVDNDGNGIVDDRDVERDGVCDCLAVAYLGSTGGARAGDVFANWLDQRSDLGAKALGTVTPSELAKYDVLVVLNLGLLGKAYSEAELAAIEAWVNGGGGLLTLTGYGNLFSEPGNVNTILARFELSYRPGLVLASPSEGTIPITGWTHPHPITEGIQKIGFNNGYPVDGTGTALASEMGFDVLRAKEVGQGHVLAWGDEWITFNSEWQAHPDYQVERLWQNMLKWLSASNVCQVPIRLL